MKNFLLSILITFNMLTVDCWGIDIVADCIDLGNKVPIIGGGAAGSYAAYCLKKRGYQSVIFEAGSQEEGTGKCVSLENEGKYYDQGAIQVPFFYKNVHKLINKFGLTTISSPPIITPDGRPITEQIFEKYGYVAFVKAYLHYGYLAWTYQEVSTDPIQVEKYPELQMSIGQFLMNNNLKPMKPLFKIILSRYGYGSLDDIAAADALSIMPCEQIMGLAISSFPLIGDYLCPKTVIIREGYQHLVSKIADASQAKINYNTKVTDVWSTPMQIFFKANRQWYKSKRLIITIPPNDSMKITYENSYLNDVLGKIKKDLVYSSYGTTIFKSKIVLPEGLVLNPDFKQQKWVPTMYGTKGEDKEIGIAYAYGEPHESAQVEEALRSFFTDNYENEDLTILEQKFFPTYYPHPSLEAIQNGFYSKLKILQGKGKIYYTGGWTYFEIVERTLQSAKQIITTYFPEVSTNK